MHNTGPGGALTPAQPPKATPGQRIAVVSPSIAAPAINLELHLQAMRRLTQLTGMETLEYPSTRTQGAPPAQRARDIMAAFADPNVGAVMATMGGFDQDTVIPHLDPQVIAANPKPFLGYSDNTHLLHFMARAGVAGYYGGSTQVHLGPGPKIDTIHARSLLAAVRDGGRLQLDDPGESEDHGVNWDRPECLDRNGERTPTSADDWLWSGPLHSVAGPTWGGCLEVLRNLERTAMLAPAPTGCIALLEASERLTPPEELAEVIASLRPWLRNAVAVLIARPPTSSLDYHPTPSQREQMRAYFARTLSRAAHAAAGEVPVCVGIPFGHTRPQWIVPLSGTVEVDAAERKVWATY